MKHLLTLLTLVFALATAGVSVAMDTADPQDVGLSPLALDHLEKAMTALVETDRRAGVVWAVAKDGKLVALKAAGHRNREDGLPMETDSLFRYYSMTRTVTTVAVMINYEEGRFELDDPVSKYIPAFADTPVLKDRKGTETEPQATPLTVYHLLTYTSGLGYPFDYDPSLEVTFEKTLWPGLTIREGVDYLATRPLLFQPGARWYYGFSSDVLARLVEIWSGRAYDAFLQERVFDPLGLTDMGFTVPDDDWHRMAEVYAPGEDGGLVNATARVPNINSFRDGETIFSGGGGLAGTAMDYLRVAQMLLNGGTLDGTRLLKTDTVALMTRNHLTPDQGPLNWYAQGRFADNDPWTRLNGYGWGLSIGVRAEGGDHAIAGGQGEFKWDGLANTTYFVDPENGIVAVALAQYLGPGQDDLEMALRTSLYGAVLD